MTAKLTPLNAPERSDMDDSPMEASRLWAERLADITEANRLFDEQVEEAERKRAAKLSQDEQGT